MDEGVWEVTPAAALSTTTALFLELTAVLHKRGVISAPELGRRRRLGHHPDETSWQQRRRQVRMPTSAASSVR